MRRFRRNAVPCVAIISAAVLCGCAGGPHRPATQPRRVVLTSSQVAALRSFGRGDTAFGLNLLHAICDQQPGTNVLISPVSLATGLGMAYLGARGSTAAAMARVLNLRESGRSLMVGLRARRALLASLNRPGVIFDESNRLWADPSLPTSRPFAAELRRSYRAGVTGVPLLSAPDQAITRIDSAVAAQTRGHINNLLAQGSISPGQIGWVLTNALYLKAAWRHRFDKGKTAPGPFRTGNGNVVKVPYMHGSGYPYAGTATGWAATELKYRGGRLAMLALLPPVAGPGRAPAVQSCQVPSSTALHTLLHRLARQGEGHEIAMPKVKLASSASLKSVLIRLGMGVAFSRQADFSGISPAAWRLGFVQHAACLAVDENGAVASAATAVGIQATALPVPIIFDRPYLLVIRDMLTGEPLMMAWVANPSKV